MAKYKPIEYDIFPPKTLPEGLLVTLYALSKISQRVLNGIRGFKCGNPNCKHETVINEKLLWIPRRCLACGEEFDWEDKLVETMKICPSCKQIYPNSANFCVFHPIEEKIQLSPFERRVNK